MDTIGLLSDILKNSSHFACAIPAPYHHALGRMHTRADVSFLPYIHKIKSSNTQTHPDQKNQNITLKTRQAKKPENLKEKKQCYAERREEQSR